MGGSPSGRFNRDAGIGVGDGIIGRPNPGTPIERALSVPAMPVRQGPLRHVCARTRLAGWSARLARLAPLPHLLPVAAIVLPHALRPASDAQLPSGGREPRQTRAGGRGNHGLLQMRIVRIKVYPWPSNMTSTPSV
jgi:hypothetical protein